MIHGGLVENIGLQRFLQTALGTLGYYEEQRFPRLSFHNTQSQAQAHARPSARPRPTCEMARTLGTTPYLIPTSAAHVSCSVSPTSGNGYATSLNNTASLTEHPVINRTTAGPSRGTNIRNTALSSRPEPLPPTAENLYPPKGSRHSCDSTASARVSHPRFELSGNKRIKRNHFVP